MSAERLPPAPLALRARLGELEACWLEVRCGQCPGGTVIPLKLMAKRYGPGRSLGAILPRLRCKQCGTPPAEAWLNETHNRERKGDGMPGWSVRLMPVPADPHQ